MFDNISNVLRINTDMQAITTIEKSLIAQNQEKWIYNICKIIKYFYIRGCSNFNSTKKSFIETRRVNKSQIIEFSKCYW